MIAKVQNNYQYIDPETLRKDALVRDRLTLIDGFPVFSILEFNVWQNCNRACKFCPMSMPKEYKRKNEGISLELYWKIMKDLAALDYRGFICFAAKCEPLLHPDIMELVSLTSEIVPGAYFEIITNGDKFKHDKGFLDELFRRGVDTVSVSIYDGPDAMIHFQKMIAADQGLKDRMILRRRFLQDGNWGLTINNRAGMVDSNRFRDKMEEAVVTPISRPCYLPFYHFLIESNGDAMICPYDWRKQHVAGNVGEEHIMNVWEKERFQKFRLNLAKRERTVYPCSVCDAKGDLVGGAAFRAWKDRFYE